MDQSKVQEFIATIRSDLHKALDESLAKLAKQLSDGQGEQSATTFQMLFQMIEQEFGRLLSSIEMETICFWIDEHDEALIKAALKEAVMQNKRSIRYIEGILNNWKNNNVRTLDEVKTFSEQFRKPHSYTTRKLDSEAKQPAPSFNWLNG